jgi:hypothetical protein
MFNARAALTLLAKRPDGSTEQIMCAHGFPAELITKLVEAGFAAAATERVTVRGRALEVRRIRITERGRQALAE